MNSLSGNGTLGNSTRKGAKRRRFTGIAVAVLLAGGAAVVPLQAAQAAAGDLAFGVVRADANKDNAANAAGPAGERDLGVKGVKVSLQCVTPTSPSAVGWTTETADDGSWSFPSDLALDEQCEAGSEVSVSIETTGVAGNVYATHAASSADNQFISRSGENQIAEAPAFDPADAPVELNGLVWPTWKFDLAIPSDPTGYQGKAVYTGTAPFDANDTEPGFDSSANNGHVRAGDTVSYNWSLTASAEEALADSTSAVILEQTIDLSPGAAANFARIPVRCTPEGGGGSTPASSIKALPSGTAIAANTNPPAGTTSVVLSCNLGSIGLDTAAIMLPTTVWVGSSSTNGTTYTTNSRVYAVAPEGAATGQPSGGVQNGPIDITSAPRFDLQKSGVFSSSWVTRNINGVPTVGRDLVYSMQISTDRKLGSEALAQPITVQDTFTANNPSQGNALVTDLEYYMIGCGPNGNYTYTGTVVAGRKNIGLDPNKAVSDSGTCSFTRPAGDNTGHYTLTFNNIDLSGSHYPTSTLAGADLTNGPFYVASYAMTMFVPMTEIDKSDGIMGNATGHLSMSNQLGGFDPMSLSGTSNYGSEFEPGYCALDAAQGDCALMPNGNRSNNVIGPYGILISPGSFSKTLHDHRIPWNINGSFLPGQGGSHDGAATIQPGQVHQVRLTVANGGSEWAGLGTCDVFDNTTLKLAPLNKTSGLTNPQQYEDDRYAYLHSSVLANGSKDLQKAWSDDNFIIQYGEFDLSGDNANDEVFDQATGRFGGVWTQQAAARCTDDGPINGWKDSVAAAGGVDKINALRIVAKPGVVIEPGQNQYGILALEQRDTFNGGPHGGQVIPAGTVAADFGQATTETLWPNWTMPRSYAPQPENNYVDGDRWTVVRSTGSLLKRTITVDGVGSGAADYGQTGVAIAGRPVIWEIKANVISETPDPAPIRNVKVTDTLPQYVKYDDTKTAELTGGTPATTVTENPDGTTTLVWDLGDVTPNSVMQPLIIYTETDTLAPANTGLVNTATLTSDTLIPVAAHTDTHQVILEQTGEMQLKKEVDYSLDYEDADQQYVLILKNYSETLAVQPPTVIEVLSFNGDASGGGVAARTPASKYSGTNGLQGAVKATDFGGADVAGTTYYTSADPATVSQNIDLDDPAIWFTQAQFGSAGAPSGFGQVTAFKFVSDAPLLVASNDAESGLKLNYGTKQTGNKPGDLYANRFTAFSDTFSQGGGLHQLLTSNQTTVRVVGFSLGDFVWLDNNANGIYEEASDLAAPAGIPIEVYRDGVVTPVATTTTDADGRWIVNDLARGDYYASIPASAFAAGGPLRQYEPSANAVVDPNTDVNEDVDHHAIAGTAGAARTAGLLELQTNDDGPVILGLEPLSDNVKNLKVSTLTTDEFTNFTLDMAFAPVPGYEFSKSSNPVSGSAVAPGQEITYTLTGANTGITALDPVAIDDDLAEVLAHATMTADPVAVITGASGVPEPVLTDTNLTWSGKLEVGQTITVTYTVTLNDDAEGVIISNVANSQAEPPVGPPIVPEPGETFHPTPGFTFWKEADPASGTTVIEGSEITYTLYGHNFGETILDPVVITDDLAQVLAYAEMTTDPEAVFVVDDVESPAPAPRIEDGKLVWDQTLEMGQAVQITYTVTVKANMEGKIITNRAFGAGTPPGLPPINTPEISTEHPVPGYEVDKTADPASGTTLSAGSIVTYTVTGTNTGATVLNEVTIEDDLSDVLAKATLEGAPVATIVGGTGGVAQAPTVEGVNLSWVGDLEIGQKVVLTYKVKINDNAFSSTINNIVTSHATPPGVPTITPPPAQTTHSTESEKPEKLVVTGAQLASLGALTALTLGLGTAVVAISRRRARGKAGVSEQS